MSQRVGRDENIETQWSDRSQTGNPWSFARILSANCSKMPRTRPLTAAFPGLKIKN
jgi:hypothetical protein